jgi:hypothetical protein
LSRWEHWPQIEYLVDGVDLASNPLHSNPNRSLPSSTQILTSFT